MIGWRLDGANYTASWGGKKRCWKGTKATAQERGKKVHQKERGPKEGLHKIEERDR